jgi:hypothetical protein
MKTVGGEINKIKARNETDLKREMKDEQGERSEGQIKEKI